MAGLRLVTTIELDHVLRVQVELVNIADRRYSLDGLTVTLPLPEHASRADALRRSVGARVPGAASAAGRAAP